MNAACARTTHTACSGTGPGAGHDAWLLLTWVLLTCRAAELPLPRWSQGAVGTVIAINRMEKLFRDNKPTRDAERAANDAVLRAAHSDDIAARCLLPVRVS